jgi:hypothetical protein
MPKLSLQKVLSGLMSKRQEHLDALADIDALFARHGITLAEKVNPTPKKKGKVGRRRRRQRYDQTAEEFVLGVLAGKTLTTAQVNAAWKKADRGGRAENALTKLVQARQVKRVKVKGERGSQYSVA